MEYKFTAKIWQYPGAAGWHFISLDETQSRDIKQTFGPNSNGFGSIKVEAEINNVLWRTSIFPDSKRGVYLLPLKKVVRKRAKINANEQVEVVLKIII